MKLFRLLACSLLALGLGAASIFAEATQSNVGHALPPLNLTYVRNPVAVQGKPLLLEFWATWCPPCRRSIPHLNEIYAKYKARGLVVVGVTDEDRPTVEAFFKKIPMNYTVAIDPNGSLAQGFGIDAIPHAMLVNKAGKIVWEGHPMALTDSAIESILN